MRLTQEIARLVKKCNEVLVPIFSAESQIFNIFTKAIAFGWGKYVRVSGKSVFGDELKVGDLREIQDLNKTSDSFGERN